MWHTHPSRAGHNVEDISVKLKLISVICLKNSHYVCFTRVTGSGEDQWLFFDSMAERQGMVVTTDVQCTISVRLHSYPA